MTHKQLVVLGTPGGNWMAGARRLFGDAGAALQVGTEADLRQLDAFAQARLLVLVDDPARALARSLVREPARDIEAWLDDWTQVGRRLLQVLQTRPDQALFVAWDEALRAPDGFAACVRERLQVDATPHAAGADDPIDAAALALSRLAVARHRQAGAIAAELDAACIPLAGSLDEQSVPDRAGPSDYLRDVSLAWSTVAAAQRKLIYGARSEETALGRVRELDHQVASTSAALQTAERELNAANAARIAARDELESLQLKLAFDAQDRAAKGLALDAAKRRLDDVLGDRDACRLEVEKQSRQVATLQMRVLQIEKEDAHLLMQLHQTQEAAEREIESRQLAHRRLRDVAERLATRQSADALTASKVVLGTRRDEEPHRELDVTLTHVQLHGVAAGDFELRLIEHRGHPGLVVFEAERPLLSCWSESGSEGERRYMLLVPADEAGSTLLDRLPSADRRCLDDVIGLLERTLIGTPTHAAWLAVVRRLHVEIKERKPRFRFNAMEVKPVEAKPSTLEVAFIGAEFGVRSWSVLRARWQPGAQHPVELVHGGDPAEMFPLRDWRRLAGGPGQPPDAWVLPLVCAPGRSEGFDAWQGLDATDASFVTALLDALPAAALRAVESDLVPREDATRLVNEAHLLLRLIPVAPVPRPRGWRGVARRALKVVRGRRPGMARGQGAPA